MNKLFLLVACLQVLSSNAQKLNPDRPDQSDGANILAPRNTQLESSLYYTVFENRKTAWISSTLVRYGLVKNLEVRFLAEQGKKRNLYLSETSHSQFPLALGAKLSLARDLPDWPDLSVEGNLQLPFTNGRERHQWSPSLLLIAEKAWEPLTVTINIGPKQEVFSPDWDFQSTCDLKWELNPHLEMFTEYFAQFSKALPFHNVDGGILYHLNNHCLVHLSAGTSINHHPSNYFVNTGFAVGFN